MKGLWIGVRRVDMGLMLAALHHPDSHTWRWALYYSRHAAFLPRIRVWRGWSGFVILTLPFGLGELDFRYQQHCWRETSNG